MIGRKIERKEDSILGRKEDRKGYSMTCLEYEGIEKHRHEKKTSNNRNEILPLCNKCEYGSWHSSTPVALPIISKHTDLYNVKFVCVRISI